MTYHTLIQLFVSFALTKAKPPRTVETKAKVKVFFKHRKRSQMLALAGWIFSFFLQEIGLKLGVK